MKRIHEIVVFGFVAAFFSACAGLDDAGQALMFVFGIAWGRMIVDLDVTRADGGRP